MGARTRSRIHGECRQLGGATGVRKTVLNIVLLTVAAVPAFAAPDPRIGINVVLKGGISAASLAELGKFGRVADVIYLIDALTMKCKASQLAAIRALPFGRRPTRTRRATAPRWMPWRSPAL
jgi:hypothetical protein